MTRSVRPTLRLYDTFRRELRSVCLSDDFGSFYICGPTVYSGSHLGHALTYIRSDLFRRFMKSIMNVRLTTVMNITDIDDKILKATRDVQARLDQCESDISDPTKHPFNHVSQKYYEFFRQDLASVRVLAPDMYVEVSKNIHLITAFIRKLEKNGHAYVSENGDVYFSVTSIDNYVGRIDRRSDLQSGQKRDEAHQLKRDPRDFALWKKTKPGEPVWVYKSALSDQQIPGRPGWHVQCSAISSALFGKKLDFHWGGKDLIFPHHYNEEACCCAYHSLDTKNSLHVWANHWLHSSHLIMRDSKMSKSLGNVVPIRKFIEENTVNSLRLVCIDSHYRSDLEYNDELSARANAIDHKLKAFFSFLHDSLQQLQSQLDLPDVDVDHDVEQTGDALDLVQEVQHTKKVIVDSFCDDFNLSGGLYSILELSKKYYSKASTDIKLEELLSCLELMRDWAATCGLEYVGVSPISQTHPDTDSKLMGMLSSFRKEVRMWALEELRKRKTLPPSTTAPDIGSLLDKCDQLRNQISQFGIVLRDPKIAKE